MLLQLGWRVGGGGKFVRSGKERNWHNEEINYYEPIFFQPLHRNIAHVSIITPKTTTKIPTILSGLITQKL